MMREILFRGKRVDNGEWVEGYFTKESGLFAHGAAVIENFNDDYLVVPSTVGQYIGVNDKNGKKIFEGDILVDRWCYGGVIIREEIVEIGWEGCSFCYRKKGETYWTVIDDNEFGTDLTRYEIVGNIHDQPELMEETK